MTAVNVASTEAQSRFVRAFAAAIGSGARWPAFEEGLDLEAAYRLQHQITRAVTGGNPGGIKAGVTAAPIQQLLGLDHALIASLYGSGRIETGGVLPFAEARLIECEVAIKIGDDGLPRAIAPALEFVRLCFSRQSDMNAANLVASNLGTERFVVGDFVPWRDALKVLPIELHRDGEIIMETDSAQALGGPAKAGPWLWSEAIRRGHSADPDTIFLVGACGVTPPAEQGRYRASFGELGELEFSVA